MVSAEKILWNKMLNGSDEAFSIIYKSYSVSLYVYGLKFTTRQDIIEDCIQDLFINLLKNHKKISRGDNIQFYLLKAFRNNLFRLLKREKVYQEPSANQYDFQVVFSIEQSIIDKEEENEKSRLLVDSLKSLSSRQKEAIYLRYTKGFEYRQVASIMNMEVESCRNLISRALTKLRKSLKEDSRIILYLFSKVMK